MGNKIRTVTGKFFTNKRPWLLFVAFISYTECYFLTLQTYKCRGGKERKKEGYPRTNNKNTPKVMPRLSKLRKGRCPTIIARFQKLDYEKINKIDNKANLGA